ncbi:putative lipoprotein [Paraburkholderia ribeironis]|uniref:Putative lipoprotein n=1 Tax=Paraburkholderia ribeironis TaxID=1247936 RepID=A0A1N7RX85_9BURK|nr:DUF4136 domain-containing protein [Paraburkholderia ribeironis]SIT39743.1 putative lipoprotein [Paraburkholderia ribeironis]
MIKVTLICAALAAASLAGCAGPNADVHTARTAGAASATRALQGEPSYAFARMPSEDDSANRQRVEALLRDALAQHGFVNAADKSAHYLLSAAYDTRPATISVGGKECAAGECERRAEAPFALFGGRAYRHSLTLRFFDRMGGEERYKVSAVIADRNADPLQAMPLLVKSALAKLPFDEPSDWRVKLQMGEAGGAPNVISVEPLPTVDP